MNAVDTPTEISRLADRTAATADKALLSAQRTTAEVADQVDTGIGHLRQTVPPALSRVAAQAEDLARRGIDRAREAGDVVQRQAARAGDQTVGYIRDEPVKAVMIAAAVGALGVLLARWFTRGRNPGG